MANSSDTLMLMAYIFRMDCVFKKKIVEFLSLCYHLDVIFGEGMLVH